MNVPPILRINRAAPFNPGEFLNPGNLYRTKWTIWCGKKDGTGEEGEEQQDARSLELSRLDIAKVRFERCLAAAESRITPKQRLIRLTENYPQLIRSDAGIAQALLEETGRKTLEWIRVNLKQTRFDFPGTWLRAGEGKCLILVLSYVGSGWHYHTCDTNSEWHKAAQFPSLVIEP